VNREAEQALRAVAENFEATREDLERIATTLGESTVPRVEDFVPDAVALLQGRTLGTVRTCVASWSSLAEGDSTRCRSLT